MRTDFGTSFKKDGTSSPTRQESAGTALVRGEEASRRPQVHFLAGDLNYRCDAALFRGDEGSLTPAVAQRLVDEGAYARLAACDELQRELGHGGALDGFASPAISFPPTFKVKKRPGFEYQATRLPSYTDRVLFADGDAADVALTCTEHAAAADVATSDHKPVRGCFVAEPVRHAAVPGAAPAAVSTDALASNDGGANAPRRRPSAPARRPREYVVNVPANAPPGTVLRVALPSGTQLDVRVPPGAVPGGICRVVDPTGGD